MPRAPPNLAATLEKPSNLTNTTVRGAVRGAVQVPRPVTREGKGESRPPRKVFAPWKGVLDIF